MRAGKKRKGANRFAPFCCWIATATRRWNFAYLPAGALAGVGPVLTRVTSKISVAFGGIGGCGSAP
jgi:hypothetical protein